jgi:hypothetical protein
MKEVAFHPPMICGGFVVDAEVINPGYSSIILSQPVIIAYTFKITAYIDI